MNVEVLMRNRAETQRKLRARLSAKTQALQCTEMQIHANTGVGEFTACKISAEKAPGKILMFILYAHQVHIEVLNHVASQSFQ